MSYKRYSPFSIFIIVYTCIIVSFIFLERSVCENIIESNGIITAIGVILTLLEFPIIFSTIWKKFLEKIIHAELDIVVEKVICHVISIIVLLLVFTYINMIMIEVINKVLDFSKPVKRYLTVTDKKRDTYYYSKSHKKSFSYSIYIKSWVSNNSFSIIVPDNEYNKYHIGDVLETNTKSGFFGFPHYDKLKKIDKIILPVRTKFPITEEEAKPLIEKKKQEEIEKK